MPDTVKIWEDKQQKKTGDYWYLTTIYECVLCGHETKYRERIYDRPKPRDRSDRIIYRQDACHGHFL